MAHSCMHMQYEVVFFKTLNDWKLVLLVVVISSVGVLLSVMQVAVPQLQPNPSPLSLTEDSQGKRQNVSQLNYVINLTCFVGVWRKDK